MEEVFINNNGWDARCTKPGRIHVARVRKDLFFLFSIVFLLAQCHHSSYVCRDFKNLHSGMQAKRDLHSASWSAVEMKYWCLTLLMILSGFVCGSHHLLWAQVFTAGSEISQQQSLLVNQLLTNPQYGRVLADDAAKLAHTHMHTRALHIHTHRGSRITCIDEVGLCNWSCRIRHSD